MREGRKTKGLIFNIQKFSVNDGPGIRTTVFLKGCPLRCKWCSNPESQTAKIQILYDKKKCIGCHHCIAVCAAGAVFLQNDRIHIDPIKCILCTQCVRECPAHALSTEGELRTVQEIVDVCLQDVPFYEESGGGVTLSGGEMLAQPDFSIELLKALHEEGIHTCCETTGYAKEEIFQEVMLYLDEVLFDLKNWDSDKHFKGTGVHHDLIIKNMQYAIAQGKPVLPRIPVIPGFNDSLMDAEKLSEVLKSIGAERCQLLPFHQFGENKYDLLGVDYAYQGVSNLHKEELEDYCKVFIKNGIDAFF